MFSWITLFFVVAIAVIQPLSAEASVFSFIGELFSSPTEASTTVSGDWNSQNMALLQPANNIDTDRNKNRDITIVDDSVIQSEMGPLGTVSQIASSTQNNTISVYTVKQGDTLSEIAALFNVSKNTVLWANDLKSEKDLKPGDQLLILPVSGIEHTVVKGETLSSIAKKFGADSGDILSFNDLSSAKDLKVGMDIIIPGAEVATPNTSSKTSSGKTNYNSQPSAVSGYYIRPVSGGKRTQGLHGACHCGVDIASSVGTPIHSAANGTVILSRKGGWNGGYGNYVIIAHTNGTQTLYAHMSQTLVGTGDRVTQGQTIGLMGSSGNSTGSHIHFEIRGARNPF
ncbi:MAG: M23 family metallopeptidase [Candidatus Paceibacterota bacterium]